MESSSSSLYEQYTVGWICALSVEMAAAQGMLDDEHEPLPQSSNDHNTYTLGRIGSHNVVIACLPSGVIGLASAAAVVTQMLTTFKNLRVGLMVGIGGGAPSQKTDIRLGDVVVSEPVRQSGGVIQYDFGKTVPGGTLEWTGSLNKPPTVLLTALSKLKASHLMRGPRIKQHITEMFEKYPEMKSVFKYPGRHHDQLYHAEYNHVAAGDSTCSNCDDSRLIIRSPRTGDDPVIHYGLIASANQVMRDGYTRTQLSTEHNVLCFEMEAAGLMDRFPCIVVRGICDYADSHKNKMWQPYAAVTASAFAKELLGVTTRSDMLDSRPAAEATKDFQSEAHPCSVVSDHTRLPEDFQLASLIPNINEPDLDNFHCPGLRLTPNDYTVKDMSDAGMFRAPRAESTLALGFYRLMKYFPRNRGPTAFELSSRILRVYTLRQPKHIFRQMCENLEVREWLQEQIDDEVYFVLGLHTLPDATGEKTERLLSHESNRRVNNKHLGPGETVIELRLKRVRFKYFDSQAEFEVARLEKRSCWKMIGDNRTSEQEEEMVEAYLDASEDDGDYDEERDDLLQEDNDVQLFLAHNEEE